MRPYYEEAGITIYHGDCREILPQLNASVDLVLTDPPYGTGGRRRLESGQGSNPKSELRREAWDMPLVDWLADFPSVAWMLFWPSSRAKDLLTEANLREHPVHRQLFWRKLDPMPRPANQTRFSVEPIWLLSANGYCLKGGEDWFEASAPRDNRDADSTGHPYQKPIEVLRWLLNLTDAKAVLDPFMGCGTTLRAAKDLGRRAIGIEIEERYCEIAANRLRQSVMQFGSRA